MTRRASCTAQLDELQRANEERERLHDQLLHAQRMEAVGTLAAGLAHDMNNVLGVILAFAELLLAERDRRAVRADLEQIIAQSRARRGADAQPARVLAARPVSQARRCGSTRCSTT